MSDVGVVGQAALVGLVVISAGQGVLAATRRRARRRHRTRVVWMPPGADRAPVQPAAWRSRSTAGDTDLRDERWLDWDGGESAGLGDLWASLATAAPTEPLGRELRDLRRLPPTEAAGGDLEAHPLPD